MESDRYRRAVLRLGALLFRLRYYMQTPDDIADHTYRFSPDTYVRVVDETAHLVEGDHAEIVPLAEAIARAKAALGGGTLHRRS